MKILNSPCFFLLLLPLLLLPESAAAQATVAQADEPWPSFRGLEGTGRLSADLGEGSWTLQTRWVRPLGSGYAGISIVDDLLVTAGRRGEQDVVVALDLEDGSERWHTVLEAAYLGHDGSHDGPIATPALADGRVFAVGTAGTIVALRLSDGGKLWTRHLAEDFGGEEPRYGFAGSPAVADGTLIVPVGGEEGALLGLDVADGKLLWRSLPAEIYGGSPIVAEVGGRRQVLMLLPGVVAGLDPKTGEVLWREEHGEEHAAMGALSQSVLPLDDERLFVKHGEDGVMILGVTAAEVVAEEGTASESAFAVTRLGESRGLVRSYSPPSLVDGVLYGYTGRLLSAVDPSTGEVLWRSRSPGDGFLLGLADRLVVLTKKGTLHLGQADREGWSESDQISLFSDLAWTAPSAAGTSIYARSLGEIARVDLVRGQEATPVEEVRPPQTLQPLADEIAAGADAAEAVTRFLAGRELPLVDGEDVLFLWRGEAEDVTVAGDMLGIRRDEVMHRLSGSDLWWWQTRLDRRARISYLFFVDNQPAVDPSHRRRARSSILGEDLDWQRDKPLEMSWFAMPEWPGWEMPGRGRLTSIEVSLPNPDGETTPKRFRVWLPPGYDADEEERYPVVYQHHPDALEKGRWQESLDRVVGRTVAPVIVVFLEESAGEALGEVLVPAIDAHFRTHAEATSRANVGMGFFAEAAVNATFRDVGTFGLLGFQSYFGIEQQLRELKQLVGEADASSLPLKIYLEWGMWDIHSAFEAADVRDSGRKVQDLLDGRGWEIYGGEMADATDFFSWNLRTELLLATLFPIDGEVPQEELRRWLGPTTE